MRRKEATIRVEMMNEIQALFPLIQVPAIHFVGKIRISKSRTTS